MACNHCDSYLNIVPFGFTSLATDVTAHSLYPLKLNAHDKVSPGLNMTNYTYKAYFIHMQQEHCYSC